VTCALGDLASGATATVTVKVRPQSAGTFTNTATVEGSALDPDGSNNTATESTTVNAAPDCGGAPATIIGTSANDKLTGTAGNDIISALAGNDIINGLGGNDTICGGDGADTLNGGPGADFESGGAGSDAAGYADRATGVTVTIDNVANDGNSGDGPAGARDNVRTDIESLVGGPGADTLTGSATANTLDGRGGADVLSGLGGIDTASYVLRTVAVTVDIDDVADDGNADDGPLGARDNVKSDIENLVGGSGDDTLTGSAADNTLDGRKGADVLSGLAAGDTVTYATRTVGVSVDIDNVADDGNADDGPAGARDNVKSDISNLIGGSGADTLTGNASGNRLTGGLGADSLIGLNANDILFANDGVADAQLNCDGGTTPGAADSVHVDSQDPSPSGCESVGP
jgi:Ca2+-binding RTX toxin-like protein